MNKKNHTILTKLKIFKIRMNNMKKLMKVLVIKMKNLQRKRKITIVFKIWKRIKTIQY